MKIYISLPISGHDIDEARRHADLVKSALSRLGHRPVSPFEVFAGNKAGYFDYITSDLLALSGCDAIMMCRGWRNSKGCQLEKSFADIYGKKVMFESVELP